jgi:hypothetical protein
MSWESLDYGPNNWQNNMVRDNTADIFKKSQVPMKKSIKLHNDIPV